MKQAKSMWRRESSDEQKRYMISGGHKTGAPNKAQPLRAGRAQHPDRHSAASVRRAHPVRTARNYANWHGNITRPDIGVTRPNTLEELVDAIRTTECFPVPWMIPKVAILKQRFMES